MKKCSTILFLALFLVSCNKDGSNDDASASNPGTDSGDPTVSVPLLPDNPGTVVDNNTGTDSSDDTTTDSDTTNNSDTNTGLPNQAYTFDSNIVFIQTTADQQAKFDKAVEIIKKVVATDEFRSKVLNHTYNGVKTFVDNGGYTNAQIYQKVLDAAEKLFPAKNNAMDMEVELYYAATTTVGYTYSNSKRIWVNTKYFNTFAATSVAANLFHEWLHKVGFGHAVSYSVSRDYSVPYAVGRMISSIGKQFL